MKVKRYWVTYQTKRGAGMGRYVDLEKLKATCKYLLRNSIYADIWSDSTCKENIGCVDPHHRNWYFWNGKNDDEFSRLGDKGYITK